jgi:hypothetical protein
MEMTLNHTINNIKVKVPLSHFTKNPADAGVYHDVLLFGIQSVPNKILTFHGMTDYGMLRSRIPLDKVYWREPVDGDIEPNFKMLWDCFSENVSVIVWDYLKEKRCQVALRDRTRVWAKYLFTVDWYNNSYSDEPTDYKCGHVLAADAGYLMCQPNNRIYWKDSNWVTKGFPIPPKNMKVDTELIAVESYSDRWVSEDTDSFYYDIIKQEE